MNAEPIPGSQCRGSALVSMQIRLGIQHFLSMRIQIQIQGFDDQKLNKFTAEIKLKLQFTYP